MIIGVPRERKTLEKRVALTPDGAHELVERGHTVLIENDAGLASSFPNEDYLSSGCEVVSTLKEVWERSQLLVKVKEPHQEEYPFFRPDLVLFDYLHLASMPDLTKKLVESKIVGVGYELVKDSAGRLPLLEPMSEIAGKLGTQCGANYLLSQHNGRGTLLGGAIGVAPAKVVVVGAGIAGQGACEIAVGMGAEVTVLDISHQKLEALKNRFGSRVKLVNSTEKSLARETAEADLVIGAVLVPGAAAPKVITRAMVKSMRPGSVLVDISIDQGGCSETIRPTSLDDPVYIEEGVIHYGVCNIPAQTQRTSTLALAAATLPYIIKLANGNDIKGTIKNDPVLKEAVNVWDGRLTNEAVSEAVGIPFNPIPN